MTFLSRGTRKRKKESHLADGSCQVKLYFSIFFNWPWEKNAFKKSVSAFHLTLSLSHTPTLILTHTTHTHTHSPISASPGKCFLGSVIPIYLIVNSKHIVKTTQDSKKYVVVRERKDIALQMDTDKLLS